VSEFSDLILLSLWKRILAGKSAAASLPGASLHHLPFALAHSEATRGVLWGKNRFQTG